MSTLLLTRNNSFKRRNVVAQPLRIGKFFLMFALMVLASLMSLLYLMEYNGIHTKGYALKRLELERDQLQVAQEIKHTNLAKVTSLQHVRDSSVIARMVPATNPIYFDGGSAFAQAE